MFPQQAQQQPPTFERPFVAQGTQAPQMQMIDPRLAALQAQYLQQFAQMQNPQARTAAAEQAATTPIARYGNQSQPIQAPRPANPPPLQAGPMLMPHFPAPIQTGPVLNPRPAAPIQTGPVLNPRPAAPAPMQRGPILTPQFPQGGGPRQEQGRIQGGAIDTYLQERRKQFGPAQTTQQQSQFRR